MTTSKRYAVIEAKLSVDMKQVRRTNQITRKQRYGLETAIDRAGGRPY